MNYERNIESDIERNFENGLRSVLIGKKPVRINEIVELDSDILFRKILEKFDENNPEQNSAILEEVKNSTFEELEAKYRFTEDVPLDIPGDISENNDENTEQRIAA